MSYSALPSQETKTPVKKNKNPFKTIFSKAKKIFSKGKSLKQKIEQVETIDHDALWWKEVTGGITDSRETQVDQEAIKKTQEAKTRKQGLREEEKVDFGGESNAVQENITGETETKEEDNVEDLFLQMRVSEIEEKGCTSPPRVSQDFDEQRLQQGMLVEDFDEQRSQEQVQQTMCPSGFDFQHLLVLQDFPLSSFYGVDFNNLDKALKPSSNVQSLYGLDMESLAAENAALDEFYAKKKSEKVACGDDQSKGNQCSVDQSQDLLFSGSTSEEDDDIKTLKNLFGYKLYYGSLPYVLDQPATTLGLQHPLLVYVNSKLQKGGCISESRLTDKVLKLQTKYKKLVAEKGNKTPERQDFPTPGDYSFFRLSRMTWERVQESDVHREVDVCCKDNV